MITRYAMFEGTIKAGQKKAIKAGDMGATPSQPH